MTEKVNIMDMIRVLSDMPLPKRCKYPTHKDGTLIIQPEWIEHIGTRTRITIPHDACNMDPMTKKIWLRKMKELIQTSNVRETEVLTSDPS